MDWMTSEDIEHVRHALRVAIAQGDGRHTHTIPVGPSDRAHGTHMTTTPPIEAWRELLRRFGG